MVYGSPEGWEPPIQQPEGQILASWLRERPLLNRSGICRGSGIIRSRFDKYLKEGEIPAEYVETVADLVREYGYRSPWDYDD